jgi:hypothetical protein
LARLRGHATRNRLAQNGTAKTVRAVGGDRGQRLWPWLRPTKAYHKTEH